MCACVRVYIYIHERKIAIFHVRKPFTLDSPFKFEDRLRLAQ